jgi:hypothetical protein
MEMQFGGKIKGKNPAKFVPSARLLKIGQWTPS